MMADPFASDLQVWDTQHARSRQKSLGPSDVGRCLRQSAYAWHDIPPTDKRSRGMARLGSLMHLGWAAVVLSALNPQRHPEVAVEIPGLGVGHADDVDFEALVVNDLKSASDRAYTRYVTYGLRDSYWDQPELYAYGLYLAREHANETWSAGVPLRNDWTLRVTLLNRETGEEMPFERPADIERGEYLAYRMIERQQFLEASTSPEDVPREGAGPGRGFPCDYCDWVSACWPAPPGDSGLSPQSATIADNADMIQATLAEYREAADAWSKADKQKKDARAFLEGIPAGEYGDYVLAWRGGRWKDPEPDGDAAISLLNDLQIEVPMKTSKTARSISITRRKPDVGRVGDGHATLQGDLGGSPDETPSDDSSDSAEGARA